MPQSLLAGVSVLDLSSVGPAARASRWLSDYGADVVKVGPVPGRGDVHITPPFYAYSAHRQMRRVRLDLKSAEGRQAFMRLAAGADVVIESFRPGVVDRLGIGRDEVWSVNRGVVYCSITGYGQHGPYCQRAGHDLNYLAAGGLLHCSTPGEGGRPPIPGATVADSAGGGMQAVMAICAALVSRQATGEGAYLDVSVADGVLALMALVVDEYLATGVVPGPGHGLLTGRFACYDLYAGADGKWLSVAAIEHRFWVNLCRALGLERWIHHQTDDAAQPAVRSELRQVFASRDRDRWIAELAPLDTCVAPVAGVPEILDDPQFAARGSFIDAVPDHVGRPEDAGAGTFRQVGPVLAGTIRASSYRVRPAEITDTDEVLVSVGFSLEELSSLRDAGVVA